MKKPEITMNIARKLVCAGLVVLMFFAETAVCLGKESVFTSNDDKREFFREVSELIEKEWMDWQDQLDINNVEVNGSRGVLSPGGMAGPVLNAGTMLKDIKTKNMSSGKKKCLEVVAEAIADCMRGWQRGYRNDNIPFSQGSSSSFSLTPCNNVPVTVSSGSSSGERNTTEDALYDYMLYRSPGSDESVFPAFQAVAKAFYWTFQEWKDQCFIEGITAFGGVAPAPAPMGIGPGPVCGAKGSGGKVSGAYFNGQKMYEEMVSSLDTPDTSQ